MASTGVQGLRFPMVPLRSEENIPLKRTPTKPAPKVLFKKREREQIDGERSDSPVKKIKATPEEAATQSGTHDKKQEAICHQCRHWVPKWLMLHCTRLKISSASGVVGHCTKWYCNQCLLNRYGETVTSTTPRCAAGKDEWHFESAGFIWACPSCQGVCNCSVHRKRDGSAPIAPLKLIREPLVDKAKVSAKDTVKLKKPRTKEAHRPPNQNGIDMFFQKTIESNSDRRTLEPAKPPDDVGFPNPVPHSEIVKPTAAKPRMTKPLTVVDPPTFLPIRTTTDTTGFLHRLKVREFVLQFEKLFTRKLHVPTKHIIQLADPCDTPPALTMKHLFAALFRIMQVDLTNKDEQDHIKETIRIIEKSAAGSKVIQESVIDWLSFMDEKMMSQVDREGEVDDVFLAAILIDWAVSSMTCREEMEVNIESLRVLKSEISATLKTLRTEWEAKKAELHKERLKITERDLVERWKQQITDLDNEFKSESTRLANELWIESRRLSPRTACLGTDVNGNNYWLFTSRPTKSREFGGYLAIQTASTHLPTGQPMVAQEPQDGYSDLGGWWYVDRAADVRQLAKWTVHCAAQAATDKERRITEAKSRSPNKRAQTSATEVISPVKLKTRPGKGKKVVEDAGLVDTRVLAEELIHAAEWIEERWPVEEEEQLVGEDQSNQQKETDLEDREIIVLDP